VETGLEASIDSNLSGMHAAEDKAENKHFLIEDQKSVHGCLWVKPALMRFFYYSFESV